MQRGSAGQGMIHVLGGTERDRVRFHQATQNGMKFITYELFISGVFQWLATGDRNAESETADKGGLLSDAFRKHPLWAVCNAWFSALQGTDGTWSGLCSVPLILWEEKRGVPHRLGANSDLSFQFPLRCHVQATPPLSAPVSPALSGIIVARPS